MSYAQYRLSIFTQEEAGAIVAYLEHKRDHDPDGVDQSRLSAALESFWLKRARTAPPAEALRSHLADEREYHEALQSDARRKSEQS